MSTVSGLTEAFSSPSGDFTMKHDGVVHHPLGGASYVYEKELLKPVLRNLGLVPQSARFPLSSPLLRPSPRSFHYHDGS
ncbi:hypothetical protein NUW54_g2934 [Trametes sanguinea]|uniref:Uncharacterized protein n=1 Tax=Trametes sanguinea TaxID=158606 RepID=A0ACC1Q430_9APHY|nr:hypothetical protein NUW54_g2934 [Trametes sanguinea]